MAKGKEKAGARMVRYSTFLRPEQIAQMKAIHRAHGIPVAEQIRRAIDAHFKSSTSKGGR